MNVKAAIQAGDAEALRRALAADPSQANALIRWGANDCIRTHPLHYVSDVIFEGKLQGSQGVPLIEALMAAGADPDFQPGREDGKKGDTPLIGAASLGAEDVGLKLLDLLHAWSLHGWSPSRCVRMRRCLRRCAVELLSRSR